MRTATLVLPFPPSTNGLFSGKKRRFPSPRYKAWQIEANKALAYQSPLPRFDGPVFVGLAFGRPDKRRRDLGNLEKAVTDQLVKNGVLEDDSLIEELRLCWSPDVVGCQVDIRALTQLDRREQAARCVA